MKNLKELGEEIKSAREAMNLTRWDVQAKTGIASGFLGNIENGRVSVSSFHLYKLSELLNGDYVGWMILTGNVVKLA